jgi:hypothetical protein
MGRIVINSMDWFRLGLALGGSSHVTSNKSNGNLICTFDQFGLLVNGYGLPNISQLKSSSSRFKNSTIRL